MANIAIANFCDTEVVKGSCWPRFVGWKNITQKERPSGLFGLVDANIKMHRVFEDTDIYDVLLNKIKYSYNISGRSTPVSIKYNDLGIGTIAMPPIRTLDQTIRWLPPFDFKTSSGDVISVYVVITGKDIHISRDITGEHVSQGFWSMDIWKPEVEEGKPWTDIQRITQATINHVISLGHYAKRVDREKSSETTFVYKEYDDVYQEIPEVVS